jgi:hypothetical protein
MSELGEDSRCVVVPLEAGVRPLPPPPICRTSKYPIGIKEGSHRYITRPNS